VLVTIVSALIVLALPDRERRVWRQRSPELDEQQVLSSIHAELAAGASLRQAIAAAGDGRPDLARAGHLAISGAPIGAVAAALDAGPRLAAAIDVAARSGGRARAVFLRLADRAAADAEVVRQQRVLTTQARLSALIVAGMPVLWMVLGGFQRIVSLFAGGAGMLAMVGVTMELLGVGLVWRLAGS
jgi:Flp pilus assembly protein TadB